MEIGQVLLKALGLTAILAISAEAAWGQSGPPETPVMATISQCAIDLQPYRSLQETVADPCLQVEPVLSFATDLAWADTGNGLSLEATDSTPVIPYRFEAGELFDPTLLAQTRSSRDDPAYLLPNPRGKLRIPIGERRIVYGFGSLLQEPTALEGATRDHPVNAADNRVGAISAPLYVGARLGDDQAMLLEWLVGLKSFDFDLSYFFAPESLPGTFSVNLISQQDQNAAYTSAVDAPDVRLANGDIPWVNRLGGGVQYSQSVGDGFDLAVALNYQRVSIRDGLFSSQVNPVDADGNLLTVSDTGQDDLLTLAMSSFLNTVEGRAFSLHGTRLRLGLEQAIPIGRANIGYTRFTANAAQFIPLNLIRSGDSSDTLILNLQGGVTLGDVPSYDSFILGGIDTIRGYPMGAVAAGRNFLQATAEYRFPLFELNAFNYPLPIGGMVFVDYGTDFGSGISVEGSPGASRGKLGDGLGYGLGLQSYTPFGFVRAELGFTDLGSSQIHFTIGDRF